MYKAEFLLLNIFPILLLLAACITPVFALKSFSQSRLLPDTEPQPGTWRTTAEYFVHEHNVLYHFTKPLKEAVAGKEDQAGKNILILGSLLLNHSCSLTWQTVTGYGNKGWIENDPDYNSIRNEPRFMALLSKLK
jgi:hypothetical protein